MPAQASTTPPGPPGPAAAGNPRYLLRAYETADCARLADALRALCADQPRPGDAVPRDTAAAQWAAQWPRHRPHTGRRAIRARIVDALSLLRAAGVCHADGPNIVVDDPGLLRMAAGNLAVLVDRDGMAVPPARWLSRPACPPALRAVQDTLGAGRV